MFEAQAPPFGESYAYGHTRAYGIVTNCDIAY